jgi:hypothetical protein
MILQDFASLSSSNSSTKDRRQHSRPLNPVDHLISKVGIGMVDTVERYYQKYCEKPNDANARAYCLWRLRLHRRLKNDKALLESINEARNLGLHDERPGKLCWDCEF